MTEPPKDSLYPTSLADLDDNSPFNLAYQAWRQGDPLPLAAHIRKNGIRSQWEADILAGVVTEGGKLKPRDNRPEKAIKHLRLYAHIKGELNLSWDEVYRRISHITYKSEEALKKLRKREGIK